MTIFKFLNIRTNTSFNTIFVKVYIFLIIKKVTISSIKINTIIQDLYHIIIFKSRSASKQVLAFGTINFHATWPLL